MSCPLRLIRNLQNQIHMVLILAVVLNMVDIFFQTLFVFLSQIICCLKSYQMNRDLLNEEREKIHVRIRRQMKEDSQIKTKRLKFIFKQLGIEGFQTQLQQFNSVIEKETPKAQELIQILQTLKSADFIDQLSNAFIDKLILSSIKLVRSHFFSEKHEEGSDNSAFNEVLEEASLLMRAYSTLDDELVFPFLETILYFLRNTPSCPEVMYNISAITDWGAKLNLKNQFISIFLKQMNQKAFPSENDISIVYGFSQLVLDEQICFNLIRILNQYLGLNINNGNSQKGIINAYLALKNIVRYGKKAAIRQQILDCAYISRQTVRLIQCSKSIDVLMKINLFIGQFFSKTYYAEMFLEKQPLLMPILLQLLLKSKFTSAIKVCICFSITQCLIIPNVSNINYEQLLQKLIYLEYNYKQDPKIMEEFMFMYLVMMKTVDYERAADCLHRYPRFMRYCMESQQAPIVKRVLQFVEKVLNEELQEDTEKQTPCASNSLINQCTLEEYLFVIQETRIDELRGEAEKIMNMIDDLTQYQGDMELENK